ncbi:MAG: DUF1559 domain-containing protein [Phycisphaeraceae bacterium]
MNRPRKPLHGFTLVELLVVVAIIAVLMAVLQPSLSRARESARTVVCASNLKHIGLGTMMYASDWTGYLPPDGIFNTNGKPTRGMGTYWAALIYPYLSTTGLPGSGGRPENVWWYYGNGFYKTPFTCPSMEPSIMASQYIAVETQVPYGMNFMAFSGSAPDNIWFTKITNVQSPGDTAWVCDSVTPSPGHGFSLLASPGWWGPSSYCPALRHGNNAWRSGNDAPGVPSFIDGNPGSANVLFVDGHCETVGYAKMTERQANMFRGTPKNPKR